VNVPDKEENPRPSVDFAAIKKHSLSDYLTRFAFGAGISAAAAIVSALFGAKIGGVLLAFPAIMPASLTLIEKKDGRHKAAINAYAAILGSVALIAFAIVATWAFKQLSGVLALLLAAAAWLVVAGVLYVSILWLPRRLSNRGKIARPTTT
jgi:hypothetical protein